MKAPYKYLTLFLIFVSIPLWANANDSKNPLCQTSYEEASKVVIAVYKKIGDEETTNEENRLLKKWSSLENNKDFLKELERVSAWEDLLLNKGLEIAPKDYIALRVGSMMRFACNIKHE